MKIAQKVKVALDETRMLVLGAQILIGFQFPGVFQDLYSQLPPPSRYLDGVALLLMVATLALLILPGTYHRLVEKGNASGRLHALTNKLAVTALIPFTVSLGIDVGIIGERILGLVGGITAGVLVGALALFFCYGLESWRMRSTGQAERAMSERITFRQSCESRLRMGSASVAQCLIKYSGTICLCGGFVFANGREQPDGGFT